MFRRQKDFSEWFRVTCGNPVMMPDVVAEMDDFGLRHAAGHHNIAFVAANTVYSINSIIPFL